MAKTVFSSDASKLVTLLREQRLHVGVTQESLAESLDMSQSMVSKVERGERRLDVIELRHWCRALDISFVGFVRELDKRLGR
ncbi:MAG: helix-turn-helix transcriptional regulator [Phycisphaerales bacterium]|nr:helix-turn-helix transcriptional regulator [Phycisphaerales bacterium]